MSVVVTPDSWVTRKVRWPGGSPLFHPHFAAHLVVICTTKKRAISMLIYERMIYSPAGRRYPNVNMPDFLVLTVAL